MELLKDVLKWAVYCAPLAYVLIGLWIGLSLHRYVGKMED